MPVTRVGGKMTKDELRKMLGENDEIAFRGKCHDCGEDITVIAGIDNDQVIGGGGAVYKVPQPATREDGIYIKCEACFEKSPQLSNWRTTEIYSRVCGYLRPISQWNTGKQAEKAMRKDYDTEKTIEEINET